LVAMDERLLIEHGTTTMPVVRKEPDAMVALTSALEQTWSASISTSAKSAPPSIRTTRRAPSLTTRCTSTGRSRRACSNRTPQMEPEAPEIPTTSRSIRRLLTIDYGMAHYMRLYRSNAVPRTSGAPASCAGAPRSPLTSRVSPGSSPQYHLRQLYSLPPQAPRDEWQAA